MKRRQPDGSALGETKRVRFGATEVSADQPSSRTKDEELDVLGRRLEESSSTRRPGIRPTTNDDVQGSVDSKKHTLDSDEEEEPQKVNASKLDIRKVQGQEKATIEYDEGIKIMAFNMNEEEEEGHYDEEGNYVFEKKNEDVHDNWLDNVDWDSVKHKAGAQWHKMNDDGEEADGPRIDAVAACESILKHLTDDKQTPSAVLKRMNASKNLSAAEERKRRWAAKKSGVEYKNDHSDAANELTGAVDNLVSLGHMEAYNANREGIQSILEQAELAVELAVREARMKQLRDNEEAAKKALVAEATDAKSLIKDLLSDDDGDDEAEEITAENAPKADAVGEDMESEA